MAHLAHLLAFLHHHRQHLQRRNQAIARGGVIGKNDMPGLLSAQIVAAFAHALHHVAIAHAGALQLQAQTIEIAFKPQVGHHRGHHAAAGKLALLQHGCGNQRQQLIAVDHPPLLIGDDHAIGVAIQGDADIGAHLAHLLAHALRRGGAALVVDVVAVGLHPDLDHFRAQLPQRLRRHAIGRTVGTVDHHPQAIQT